MALTAKDLEMIAALIAAATGGAPPAPVVVNEDPPPVVEPEPVVLLSGPFDTAMDGLSTVSDWLWFVNTFSMEINNRFTCSDIYTMMADFISMGLDNGAEWTIGSGPSWRFAKEAFRTRASELLGDKMTTELPVLTATDLPMTDIDFGVTEALFNKIDIVLRRLVGGFVRQTEDRNKGPMGEILTTGECVRLGFIFLDAITDTGLAPDHKDSNFMKVRMECYNQYKGMGEGVFGPFGNPGGSVAWSWAGQ